MFVSTQTASSQLPHHHNHSQFCTSAKRSVATTVVLCIGAMNSLTVACVDRYGELSPSTFPGKLIGGLCALCGIFILTLPIPIVVNSFASYYKNRLWRNEVLSVIQYTVNRQSLRLGYHIFPCT